MVDARRDVGVEAVGRRLGDVVHERKVRGTIGCPCRPSEVVDRQRRIAVCRKLTREVLVETEQATHVGEDQDGLFRSWRRGAGGERIESVAVGGLEHQSFVTRRVAAFGKRRQPGVMVYTHVLIMPQAFPKPPRGG